MSTTHESIRCGAFKEWGWGQISPGGRWPRRDGSLGAAGIEGSKESSGLQGRVSKSGANSDLKTEASWRKSPPILILIQSRPRIKDRRHEPGTTLRPSPEPMAAVTWDPVLCGPEHLNNSVWLHHSSFCWNTLNHCNFWPKPSLSQLRPIMFIMSWIKRYFIFVKELYFAVKCYICNML